MTEDKQIFMGQVGCGGLAIGRACVLKLFKPKVSHKEISEKEVDKEIERFDKAIAESRQQMTAYLKRSQLPNDLEGIFEAQLLSLEDPMLIGESKEKIRLRHINAEWALEGELQNIRDFLLKSENAIFRERADDLEDIGHRILRNLMGISQEEYFDQNLNKAKGPLIIISNKISLSMFLHLPLKRVAGLVDEEGGLTNHLTILAQSHNLPTLLQVKGISQKVKEGSSAFLDGNEARLVINPDKKEQDTYQRYLVEKAHSYAAVIKSPVKTSGLEGQAVEIWANLNKIENASDERIRGLSGVSLFRTEFLYLQDPLLFAAAEEHHLAYAKILRNLKPLPVRFRLLDVGDDKPLPRQILAKQKELRGISFLLANPNLLKAQLESILIAVGETDYPDGKCSLLLPMVSSLEQVLVIKESMQEIQFSLEKRKFRSLPHVGLGIMIETPAAVEITDILSKHVDFFCLGSNDLMNLNVASDRQTQKDQDDFLYHPALYRQIQRVIARTPKMDICLCGDIAAHEELLPLLIGLGITSLGVPLPMAANCAKVIQKSKRKRNQDIAQRALIAQTSRELRELL